ncbi:MAG: DUF521 domain-containing protein [Clostridia bacterium]|nr:DUF521 domain-containing protein [Clostridia bacterium]
MKLTKEEKEILDGSQGPTMAKIMQTLVMFGEMAGAKRLVPITHEGHLVTSFGISLIKPLYRIMDEIINSGIVSKWKFTADPRPIDYKNVKCNLLNKLIFSKIMYGQQARYEEQLKKIGLSKENDFSCTCYLPEMGNTPKYGDVLSWAESSAVVFANSILGARCNRNSGMIDLFGCIIGKVPEFGLLLDENRKANWVVELKTTTLPDAQILGSAIGLTVGDGVPYIKGLDKYLGKTMDEHAISYLKDMGAASASNGAVGLYHVHNLTPEAKQNGAKMIATNAKKLVITDQTLKDVYQNYPILWKNMDSRPYMCFIGCPHLSLDQLIEWTHRITNGLKENNKHQVCVRTIFTTSPAVLEAFAKTKEYPLLLQTGIKLSSICPLMYMNNPIAGKKPIITCSNKLRTYTSARFYTEAEIVNIITGKKEK